MIGWLRGTLRARQAPWLLLDVGGVGYEIQAPMTTFYDLPTSGSEISLYTHLVVREDSHALYGFAHEAERDIFRALLRVNGVGAKVGLAILSGLDAGALTRCIAEEDTARLTTIPGIGKKTAERLIMELRDRLPASSISAGITLPDGDGVAVALEPTAEAVSALVALGFKPPEASRRIRAINEDGLACEELVRRALQAVTA